MDDIRLALMCGTDIPVPNCKIIIHQPKIKEIALIGEDAFFIGVQCLNINQNSVQIEGKTGLSNISNFQIFMMVMQEKEQSDKKDAVKQVFSLIFPDYKYTFTPQSIIFSKENQEEIIMIDESNFDSLQSILKEIFCLRSEAMAVNGGFNPADKRATEIAQKLAKGRARIAAQKGEDKSSMFSQYLSILTVGLQSMSLQNCMELTMFQTLDLIERYTLYTNWDIDIRARLAGASPDDKADNWMKNIH